MAKSKVLLGMDKMELWMAAKEDFLRAVISSGPDGYRVQRSREIYGVDLSPERSGLRFSRDDATKRLTTSISL